MQESKDVHKVAGGHKLVNVPIDLRKGWLINASKATVAVHFKIAPFLVGLLPQQGIGVLGAMGKVKAAGVIGHVDRVGRALGSAAGIELFVAVKVGPGIELNSASNGQAGILCRVLPVEAAVEAGPGAVDSKVQVGMNVNVPMPGSSQLQLEEVGLEWTVLVPIAKFYLVGS